MRTIAKDKPSSAASESGASSADGVRENWFRTHWCMVVLSVIALLAFLLRFVFAYGPSVEDSFALSGGATASSHHRIIVEILYGTYNPANEVSLNYPYGIESIYGPLFDYCCAAWAKLFSAFGASYPDAANMALAVNPPIFGALTCIPVYLIAKRFSKDNVIALVAAGFYAVFPILVMTTPFSYGSELPFVCFLMAGLVYFVLSAFDNIDKYNVVGIKGVVTQKPVLLWVALAALFMTLIVYTWTGFWAIVMATSVMLFFALLFDRVGGRDFGTVVGVYIGAITVPVVLGAIYYFAIGAWESVLSGAFTLMVITTVCALIFLALQKKPWVFTIPGMVVLIGVIAAVLHFAVPDLASDVYSGNSPYVGSLMSDLVSVSSRTTISQMAAYYGWVTVWCPLIFGVWMAIRYRANAKSKAYTFVMLWLFAGFIACWYNTEYAVITGAVYAVASAATIIGVFRYVRLKAYFRSLKGNGFKAGVKKALKPTPFATVLVAVFLVAVPTAVYAADAATPTNTESIDYFGGLGYTINTSDSSLVNSAWSGYTPTQEATLVTWYGYSDTASSVGGYKTITSTTGAGTSAMASTYLSEGSEEVIATMIVRLVEDNASKYTSIFQTVGGTIDVSEVVNYIDNADAARSYIKAHSADFAGYNSTISEENLPYLAGVHYLTSKLTERQMTSLYDDLRGATGNEINYIELDGSMIPIYYGDSSYANYIAYFGDLSLGGTYSSSPSKLYSVTSTTYYYYTYGYYDQMYYTYTDSMYATFLWNALIGVTPSEYGYSDSLSLLAALAKSDGTVKASPCAGIDNFDIAYWHVNYLAEDSTEWADMDINEALALQNANGGYINYLSSVIILEYAPSTSASTYNVTGGTDYSGVRVAVYEELKAGDMGYDPSGKSSNYVQRSTTFVDAETGLYTVVTPSSGNYLVKYYVGATNLYNGSLIHTDTSVINYTLPIIATQAGILVDGDGNAVLNSGAYLQFLSSGNISRTVNVDSEGKFTLTNVQPDTYTVNVYSASGVVMNTVSVTLSDGSGHALEGFTVSAGACTLDITVTDMFGNALADAVGVTITGDNGVSTVVTVTGGSKSISVLAGTYSVSIDSAAYVSVSNTSVTTSTSEAVSASLVAYPAASVTTETGTVAMGVGYSKIAASTTMYLPETLVGNLTYYKLNSDNSKVTVNGVEMDSVKMEGVLKNGGSNVAGSVSYIDCTNGYVFTFVTDSEGKFTAYIPSGTYLVYATNGSSLAVLTEETCSSTSVTYTLVDAYALTLSVKYTTLMSPTTKGLSYIPVSLTVDGKTFSVITNSSGDGVVYLPTGKSVKASIAKEFFDETVNDTVVAHTFTVREDFSNDVTLDQARTSPMTIKAVDNSAHDETSFVNKVSVTFKTGLAAIEYNFDAYASSTYDFSKTIADGDSVADLTPGRYTVTSKTDGYYVSKIVYIYPSTTEIVLTDDIMECDKVTVEKVNDTDKVSVVTLKQNDKKEDVAEDGNTYYLPKGGEYCFVITDEKGDKIYTCGVSATISGYALADAHSVSGSVGSAIGGKIIATDSSSNKYLAEVKDGEYSLKAAEGTVIISMKLTASGESGTHSYSVSDKELITSNVTVSDDVALNFLAPTVRGDAKNDVFTEVKVTGTMADGKGILTLKATRVAEETAAVSYLITSGTGFELTQSYILTFEKDETVATVSNIIGYYNDKAVGAGSSNAYLAISSISGTEVQSVVIPAELYGSSHGTVVLSEDSVSAMNGYSYRYALTLENSSKYMSKVSVTGTSYTGSDYAVAIIDESGCYVSEIGTVDYEIEGFSTVTVYVAFVKTYGASETATVPENLTVTYSVDGTSATTQIERASAELTIDSASVSGGNADNEKVEVSKGFWIVTVFTILLLLLLVWSGMKRGVFTRRK